MEYIIKIEDSNKVFFTSDFHAKHENIIKFCDRPWTNKEEMTESLIENWNSIISSGKYNIIEFIKQLYKIKDGIWLPRKFNKSEFILKLQYVDSKNANN